MTNLLKQLLSYKSKIINQFPNFNPLSVIPKYQSTHFYTFNELFEEVYSPVDLKIKVATVDYDSEIKEAYKNYLFDFILCLNLVNDKSLDTSFFSLSDFEKSSPNVTVENRIRLIFSPLWKYIFPPINARDSDKNCRSHNLYKKDIRIKYYTILHHVSRALRLYSKDCPYGFFIKIPKESLIDYNAQVKYLYSTPTPLHVFNQYFYDLFSRIPGGLPMASEYYAHIQDATYKNKNLTANKINTYYKGFYNSILSSLNDDNTTQQTLFDFFISELLLNGTFIYYFADIFSGSSAANLTRNISDNDFISFFNQLNQMNNFFLKKLFVDIIVDSYYNDYSIQGIGYKRGNQKPYQWKKNILHIISNCSRLEPILLFNFASLIFASTDMKITFPTQHEIEKLCSYMNINSVVQAQVHRTYKYKAILEDIVCEYHENYLSNIDISKFPKT